MDDDAPLFDFRQEFTGFAVPGLNLQDHPEDSYGPRDVPLCGAQFRVRQSRERSSRIRVHDAPPQKAKRPLRASREGAEDSKF
jgi:hypothetical protein